MSFNYQVALERLNSIDWDALSEKNVDRNKALLVNEYLFRASKFLNDFNFASNLPMFNPIEVIDSDVTVPEDIDDKLKNIFNDNVSPFIRMICKSYLIWGVVSSSYPDIYDKYKGLFGPIIYLFESGGIVNFTRNELKVGAFTIPIQNMGNLRKEFEFEANVQKRIEQD
ncbi:hypothetical protein [Aliikangiella maris]|uniref:Uncharacterized protein n=2 Tax=Aliikangiella maris TaxID=3162458 RepID=A0ABV2BWQ9_9GAMM